MILQPNENKGTRLSAPKVSKIIIINPYLQGGHTEIAESESAKRFMQAANKLDIETIVVASSDEIEQHGPDFAISFTHQEPKLTEYPTYGTLTIPTSWVSHVPRFVRNILSYDGYLTVSPSVVNWLTKLCMAHHKPLHIAHTAFSVPKTSYELTDFTQAKAVYIGTNWDKTRHNNLFHLLHNGDYLKCFGPQKSWQHYSPALYGGEIPFDGISTLATYRQHALGLCLNHPDFDREGIPSSRTFEIAASSALPISSLNPLTESFFGDTILYINHQTSTEELAEQIVEAVKWVRMNPAEAAAMAREAHQIFDSQLCMEIYLEHLLAMHRQVMADRQTKKLPFYFQTNAKDLSAEKVVYFLLVDRPDVDISATINSLQSQLYSEIDIIVLCKNEHRAVLLASSPGASQLSFQDLNTAELNQQIIDILSAKKASWFGLITPHDIFFKDHVQLLLETYQQSSPLVQQKIMVLQPSSLAFSRNQYLAETMEDPHSIHTKTKARIHHLEWSQQINTTNIPVHSCLFKTQYIHHVLNKFDFSQPELPLSFSASECQDDRIFLPIITSKTCIDTFGSA